MLKNIHLSDFTEILENPMVRLKTEEVFGQTVSIISYMIASPELWENTTALECRGITFNSKGFIICRPFHKFFNLGEYPEEAQKHIDFNESYVFDKLDGSMVTPVLFEDNGDFQIKFKTKKSFYSEVAVDADKFAHKDEHFIDQCIMLCKLGYTPIFEYVSVNNRVVLDYGEQEFLQLLTLRENISGHYIHRFSPEYNSIMMFSDIPMLEGVEMNPAQIAELVAKSQDETDKEGYVIHTRTDIIKQKTDWYTARHRLTNYTAKSLVKLIHEKDIDDIMDLIYESQTNTAEYLDIQMQYNKEIQTIVEESVQLYELFLSMYNRDIKAFCLDYANKPYFSIAIKMIRNQDHDDALFKYWKNTYHNDYDNKRTIFWK